MAIDKQIEEDSRRFRKECKILLLGSSPPLLPLGTLSLTLVRRFWRVGQVDDCEANEDYTPERVHTGGVDRLSVYGLQEPRRVCAGEFGVFIHGLFRRALSAMHYSVRLLCLPCTKSASTRSSPSTGNTPRRLARSNSPKTSNSPIPFPPNSPLLSRAYGKTPSLRRSWTGVTSSI